MSGNTIRRFDYAYNNMNDIAAVQRDSTSLGDGYTYDLNQEIVSYQQNGTVNLGNGTVSGGTSTTLTFDGCGNRTSKNSGGTYVTDSLNCPTTFDGQALTSSPNGNLWTYNNWTFTYDAQNRLTNAFLPGSKGGPNTNLDFYYDAKNRQIARNVNGTVTFSVWDDWELIEEYTTGNVVTSKYLQGAHGPVKSLLNAVYYYQDSLGSTSHIASSTGALLEYYKYDLYGKPKYYDAYNNQLSTPTVRDLFSGERWISEMSMYDLRNRFYSPDLGRFLQPDPISYKGDASNLYRYCGNDWANRADPMGLEGDSTKPTNDGMQGVAITPPGDNSIPSVAPVTVPGREVPRETAKAQEPSRSPGELSWDSGIKAGMAQSFDNIHVELGRFRPTEDHALGRNSSTPSSASDALAPAELTLVVESEAFSAIEYAAKSGSVMDFTGMASRAQVAGSLLFGAGVIVSGVSIYRDHSPANIAHQGVITGVGLAGFTKLGPYPAAAYLAIRGAQKAGLYNGPSPTWFNGHPMVRGNIVNPMDIHNGAVTGIGR